MAVAGVVVTKAPLGPILLTDLDSLVIDFRRVLV